MYKRYSREQIQSFGGSFVHNLKKIIKQENAPHIKDFVKTQFSFGNETQFRDGTEPIFRFIKNENNPNSSIETNSYVFIDEKEKIELLVDDAVIQQISTKLKLSNFSGPGDSILQILFQEFQDNAYRTINNKPFIVYDIETLAAVMNLKTLQFELGYTITSSDYNQSFDKQFKYIEKEAIKKYVDFLLDFDGYIIGFNNIGFDNIVIGYNAGYDQEIINKLHEKSIDIFYYIWNLTGKRIGLNKVATALVGLQKTLTGGGLEGTELLKDWLQTGNTESLKKVKDYCKGDVKMTLGVLLYLYKFGEFYIDNKQYSFNEKEFISLGREIKKQENKAIKKNESTNGLF